jgi:hypothetical protein
MNFRTISLLTIALSAGGATMLAAQQSIDSTRAAVTTTAPDSSARALTPWRNYVSQSDTMAQPARRSAFNNAPASSEGGQNTIVISTLALVLVAIIVVLLIR